MTSIQTQISSREAQIAKINTDLGQLRGSIPILQKDLASIICRGTGQNKVNCEGRRQGIIAMIQTRQEKIAELAKRLDVLNKEITDLSKVREAEGAAIVNLSNQGLTPEALLVNTQAQANAALEVANAQARSIETSTANKSAIIWVIVFIVAIIILVVVRKKLAK